jgi:hypothetical protein
VDTEVNVPASPSRNGSFTGFASIGIASYQTDEAARSRLRESSHRFLVQFGKYLVPAAFRVLLNPLENFEDVPDVG